jgi:hypothetical protein
MKWTAAVLCVLVPAAASATIVKVPSQQPTIQDALDACVDASNTVYVAAGEYTGPRNRNLDPAGRSIEIVGLGPVTINPQGQGRAFNFHSGEEFVLRNLTVTNAMLNWGGAAYFSGCDGQIISCAFIANDAAFGGAVLCNGGSLDISRCVFDSNLGGLGGADIYCVDAPEVVISGSSFSNSEISPWLESSAAQLVPVTCSNIWNCIASSCSSEDDIISVQPPFCGAGDYRFPEGASLRYTQCGAIGLVAPCSTTGVAEAPGVPVTWGAIKIGAR